MGEYRHRVTGEIKSQGEWRRAHPNTSFPRVWTVETLDFLELDAVFASPRPTAGKYETVRKNGVVQDAKGNWVENWEVIPMFTDYTDDEGVTHTVAEQEAAYQARLDEDKAKSIRSKRNTLLVESDWTQVADAPVDQAAWALYRQALRDITSNTNFPYLTDEDWPTTPQ